MPSLDLDRVKQLTEYTFLELQVSILYQQRWNELDGPKLLQDLMDNRELWTSFARIVSVPSPGFNGLRH